MSEATGSIPFKERVTKLFTSFAGNKPEHRRELGLYDKDQAFQGYAYFVDASAKYPKSVASQAAHIALSCKKADLDPQQIGDSLRQDNNLLTRIVDTANSAHTKKGLPPFVQLDSVKNIVRTDFTYAKEAMIFSEQELETMRDEIYRYIDDANPNRSIEKLEVYIKGRKRELGLKQGINI